uniref:G protein-coupled receptor-like protein n=1 Tax=Philodina roseola TaxID=96448 RepID=B6S315_PHIRO|nr:G protein-coupled receptor-like protein [Philodina roseola]
MSIFSFSPSTVTTKSILNHSLPLMFTTTEPITVNLSQTLLSNDTLESHLNYDHLANSSLVRYRDLYRNYHGIVSSFVCIFGLTCNLFNIIVLTRPSMRSSTNTILTSLATSDLLKMLFVLPSVILFYCLPASEHKSEPNPRSYFQIKFYMIQALFTLTSHCISTCRDLLSVTDTSSDVVLLTVFLAAFRYVFLSCQPTSFSSAERTLIGVIIVVILSTILCVPSYLEHRIMATYHNSTSTWNSNQSEIIITYRFEETHLSQLFSLREKIFVLHSIIFKLIPCLLILIFSCLLIQQLRHALEKSEMLNRHSTHGSSTTRNRARRREKENRRTTMMLVIVCVLFLVTELPQGALLLLTFLSKTRSEEYFHTYQQLGDTFDILALINNSVNFILYCLMSRAFRDTFKQTFCCVTPIDSRPSQIKFSQLPRTTKQQIRHSNGFELKCPDEHRNSKTPIIKTVEDNSSKKCKTHKALRFIRDNHAMVT